MNLLVLAAGVAALTSALDRGDLDEVARRGALAGPAVVEKALRSPGRTERLAGIIAAPGVEDRAELLPALADLAMGADRRTAIPAARAARTIARELAAHELADDLAPDDLGAWRARWDILARSPDHFVETRLLALEISADLAHVIDPHDVGFGLAAFLADRDPAVRAAAISLVPQPTPVALREQLANAVRDDSDPHVALAAAQALCADLVVDDPAPVLAALGPNGLARIRTLVAAGTPRAAVRDAARCLAKR